MYTLFQHRLTAWHFALGFALAGLILVFIGAALLVFPYKAVANPETQSELLYDLLGSVDYQTNGQFNNVNDDRIQRRVKWLINSHRLDGKHGAAYIRNLNSKQIVWTASSDALSFDTSLASRVYDLQFIHVNHYQLAIQNFWVRFNSKREEFQMVVALPSF